MEQQLFTGTGNRNQSNKGLFKEGCTMTDMHCKHCKGLIRTSDKSKIKRLQKSIFFFQKTCDSCATEQDIKFEVIEHFERLHDKKITMPEFKQYVNRLGKVAYKRGFRELSI